MHPNQHISRRAFLVAAGGTCVVSALASAGESRPPVTAAVFTPDGNQLATGSQAGIRLFGWPSLKPVGRIATQLSHVHDLVFASDGLHLAAAGGRPADEGTLEVFRWSDDALVRRSLMHDDLIYGVAPLPDDRWVSASADGTVNVIDRDGNIERTLTGHAKGVLTAVVLPDGATLVTAGLDQSLRVWNAATGELKRSLAIHTGPVLGLAVRPSEDPLPHPYVASISEDRTVRLWQPTIGRMVRFVRLVEVPLCVAWTHDGRYVAAGCRDGLVRIIDPDTVEVVAEYVAGSGYIWSLAAHPTRREFAAGGTDGIVTRIAVEQS
ncbi:WD domain, G-beta repeat [Maioricimonas rarisocia]|uniref:WD domain, G-beta repeat n=1 Tax=Maioricimonas rarisocia TaxID=2528026 RepID=A0A517Z5E1_9PLAN|nr:WD40 repeat domain-containing protein [Maioricimonas rarisocia]QDU37679.1 WD domain, G-beta repeat [Maioricimonas rarisocia]